MRFGAVGSPVMWIHHHGTGTSALEGALFSDAATTAGVDLLVIDRPGIAGSSPRAGRQLEDWPRDLLAFADDVGFGRFVVSGISGGGAHALAVAAASPERVVRCVPINGAPASDDAAVLAAIPRAIRLGPVLARRAPRVFARTLVPLQANQRLSALMGDRMMASEDRAVLADPAVAERFAATAAEARSSDPRFFAEALILWQRAWPFDPYGLRVPLTVVTGAVDPFRPFAEELVRRNHDARLLVVEGGRLGPFAPRAAEDIFTAVADEVRAAEEHPTA